MLDEARWHRQLDRLAARARGRRLDTLVQDGARFTQLLEDREHVVALLVRATKDGSYRPSHARLTRARLGGREREIARIGALDLVVHAVVAEVLAERLEPRLSPNLYSYRKGRSPWQALRALGRVAAAHRAARAHPLARGLHVLRGDIKSYTDSIPIDDGALFWRELEGVLGTDDRRFAMVRALLQPPLDDGATRARGLLFGAPTTNVAGNLYLMELDEALDGLGGSMARFGDDVLFADADPARVREALTLLERILQERGLEPNRAKLRVLFWNGAARPSVAWPETAPVSVVPFLGASIGFTGVIALAPAKWKSMLREVRARIQRTARLLPGESPEEIAKVLAGVINESFDVRSELALREAGLINDLVSDRTQLAQLDYWVARWIVEAATKRQGPRAFRELSFRWLRRSAGLGSRVVARNAAR